MFSANSFVGCAAFLALFASNVDAHGSVSYILNNGVKYGGPQPLDQAGTVATGPIRQIFSEQPVTEDLWTANSSRLACDQATNIGAPKLATVAAGSVISAQVSINALYTCLIGQFSHSFTISILCSGSMATTNLPGLTQMDQS